jgi:hypothetical protein
LFLIYTGGYGYGGYPGGYGGYGEYLLRISSIWVPVWNPYGALRDSCVDPHRKTMDFHMKNLYECVHLGCKNEEKKKSIKPPFLKGVSIWDSSIDSIWSIP